MHSQVMVGHLHHHYHLGNLYHHLGHLGHLHHQCHLLHLLTILRKAWRTRASRYLGWTRKDASALINSLSERQLLPSYSNNWLAMQAWSFGTTRRL